MDALMICLLASALSALGGRWWLLIAAISQHLPRATVITATMISIMVCSSIAAIAGNSIANQFRGSAMALFLSLALLIAGLSLCWPVRTLSRRLIGSAKGAPSAIILLLAAQIGDSAPFIILAATAYTGSPLLAGAGGVGGLVAVAASAMMLGERGMSLKSVQYLRWLNAAVLIGIALVTALIATGRI